MKKLHTESVSTVSRPVHVIVPTAVYDLAQAREGLGLAKGTLPREVRLNRLRVAKRAGKYLVLGSWLLEWIEAGEVRRRRPSPVSTENGENC